ncbi:MAG: YerC/YecD family TrpR-related protein [Bacillota bacterium]|nr:YerC/YecD family TrpR-related protein [Bacillota bacterium]
MVNEKLRSSETDRLFEAVLSLRDREECYRFFEDLCTVAELRELSQRFEVACLLSEGGTYHEIVARTGASTATVSRVKRALEYGADGYKLVLARMAAGKARRQA